MQHCKPPKCHRTASGDCGYPNPWHTFLKLGMGKGLTDVQRKKKYATFKNDFLRKTGNDAFEFRLAPRSWYNDKAPIFAF